MSVYRFVFADACSAAYAIELSGDGLSLTDAISEARAIEPDVPTRIVDCALYVDGALQIGFTLDTFRASAPEPDHTGD